MTTIRNGVAISILLLALSVSGSASPAVPVRRCAVIASPAARSDGLADLVMISLARREGIELVEREVIDRILKEQELSALSAAGAVSNRLSLGRLLKADLLVLLDRVGAPAHTQVVVSETARGVRLRVAGIPASSGAPAAAEAVVRELDAARRRVDEPFAGICAVPPLVSRDLATGQEHLQSAYARLIEATLLNVPGVLVVEIAEARALAEEMELAGGEVRRALPLHVVGTFRFDAKNAADPPRVRLEVQRDGHVLAVREAAGLTPETAAPFLRGAAVELVRDALTLGPAAADAGRDGAALAERAREHYAIGHYEEAVQLAEAGLLVRPDHPELRFLAMSAYGRCCWQAKKSLLEAVRYGDRAAYHLERFLTDQPAGTLSVAERNMISEALGDSNYRDQGADAATRQAVQAFRRRTRDMYVRVLEHRRAQGTLDETLVRDLLPRLLIEPRQYGASLQEDLEFRRSLLPTLLDPALRQPGRYVRDLDLYGLVESDKRTPAYEAFVAALERHEHRAVREQARYMRAQLTRWAVPVPDAPSVVTKAAPAAPTGGVAEIEFAPLVLKRRLASGVEEALSSFRTMPCGQGLDLVWDATGAREVYLMRRPGVLEMIHDAGPQQGFGQACYDGVFAWLPVTGPQSEVLRIDPRTGSVLRFGAADGLPGFETAAAAATAQGQLCLSGGFGKQLDRRAFVALLTVDQRRERRVSILHEATRQALPGTASAKTASDVGQAYWPKFMLAAPAGSRHEGCALLARSLEGDLYTSLLIDARAAGVSVVDAAVDSHILLDDVDFHDGAAYWGTRRGLRSFGFDNPDGRILCALPEEGRVVWYNRQLHVVGKDWWTADAPTAPFRKRIARVPPGKIFLHQFMESEHYGLIFRTSDADWRTYRVEFRNRGDGTAPKRDSPRTL